MIETLTSSPSPSSEAAIFSRVFETGGELSVDLAKHVLSLNFSEADRRRVTGLVERNQLGQLDEAGRQELDNFNHVADLLSLWHSRARLALRKAEATPADR